MTTVLRDLLGPSEIGYRHALELAGYVTVVTLLTFSALMYLVARQSALERFRRHERVPRAELDHHFFGGAQSMTVLVPSYREELDIIRMTLWSAALQEFSNLRVVLLIDDPPFPTNPDEQEHLEQTREVISAIGEALAVPRARSETGLATHHHDNDRHALEDVITDYRWSATWLRDLAASELRDAEEGQEGSASHVANFFAEQVLCSAAVDLDTIAGALEQALAAGVAPTRDRIIELRRRLVRLFSAELTTFERKRYLSLSDEANKAMNLNAYLGLMGGHYRVVQLPGGELLEQVPQPVKGGISVPWTEYVLTLDADSLLLPEYCLRLVHEMEQPGNDRIAVIQTPYSAYRGAPSRLERLAGATTDLQHVLHQGFTAHNATFWVGANAVIRRDALDDIEQIELVDGIRVVRYVQDRTPIEDTESSIDLLAAGWTLANYPERLSYSATPTDFGSLVVQRRRWANGGLLICQKYFSQVRDRRRRGERVMGIEVAMRVNYMASIAWSSFALLLLLFYPFDSTLLSPMVLLTAAPYALAMASDLRAAGYRASDVLRIYGFNLILLPVNLAGVLKSIEQAITGRKIPFARTPKVRNRIATPAWYVVAPLLIIAYSGYTLWHDVTMAEWGGAVFAGVNCVLASWAFVSYMGVITPLVDVLAAIGGWAVVRNEGSGSPSPAPAASGESGESAENTLDWQTVLHHGSTDPTSIRRTLIPLATPTVTLPEVPHNSPESSDSSSDITSATPHAGASR